MKQVWFRVYVARIVEVRFNNSTASAPGTKSTVILHILAFVPSIETSAQ